MLNVTQTATTGLIVIVLALGLQSCSDSDGPDLAQTLKSLPLPSGIIEATAEASADDAWAWYLMPDGLTPRAVLDFYKAELTDRGWEQESSLHASDIVIQTLCQGIFPLRSCLGFVKGDVRVTVQVESPNDAVIDTLKNETPQPDSFRVLLERR